MMYGRIFAALALAGVPLVGFAGEVTFKGFASAVVGQASEEGTPVYGYTDEFSFKRDSLFALQMDSQINEKVSATMQFMSRGKNDFEVDVEWGYLTLNLTPTWDLSLGRIRIPFYRYSDFLDVRYAYNWVTPPDTVYGFEIPGYEGASILNTTAFGSWDSTFQIVLGNVDNSVFNEKYIISLEDLMGVNWVVGRESLSLRFSALTAQNTATSDDLTYLISLLRNVPVVSDATVDSIEMKDDRTDFFSAGLSFDPGAYFFEAEYIHYEIDDGILPTTDAWYVTGGFRAGDFTGYLTYSSEKDDPDYGLLDQLSSSNDQVNQQLEPLREGTRTALDTLANDTKHWNVGVRWDVMPSTALKLSYEQNDYALTDETIGLMRFGIDVVF